MTPGCRQSDDRMLRIVKRVNDVMRRTRMKWIAIEHILRVSHCFGVQLFGCCPVGVQRLPDNAERCECMRFRISRHLLTPLTQRIGKSMSAFSLRAACVECFDCRGK